MINAKSNNEIIWFNNNNHRLGIYVSIEAVWAVPNDASSTILNVLGGTIALALRGNASFADKARYVQKVRYSSKYIDNYEMYRMVYRKTYSVQ